MYVLEQKLMVDFTVGDRVGVVHRFRPYKLGYTLRQWVTTSAGDSQWLSPRI